MRRFAFILAACTIASAACAEPILFSAKLLSPDGKPFQECAAVDNSTPPRCTQVEELTLGTVVTIALNQRDDKATYQDIVQRGTLADKISKANGGQVDITVEEVKLAKDAVLKTQLTSLEKYSAIRLLEAVGETIPPKPKRQ